jgi:hypothetical protein
MTNDEVAISPIAGSTPWFSGGMDKLLPFNHVEIFVNQD